MYGSTSVNPYSSYFGSHGSSSSGAQPSTGGGSPLGSPPTNMFGGSSTGLQSPSSSSYHQLGNPFFSPTSAQKGSSPVNFSPSPSQTRIIGGVSSSNSLLRNTPTGRVSSGGAGNLAQFMPSYSSSPRKHQDIGNDSPNSSMMQTSPAAGSGSGHHSPQNSVFLPSFFLGLDQYPTTSGSSFHNVSPQSPSGLMPQPHYTSLLSPLKSPKKVTFANGPGDDKGVGSSNLPVKTPKKGPPKIGFGYSEGPTPSEFLKSPLINKDSAMTGEGVDNISAGLSDASRAQSSPNQGSSKCWVTIFGFPDGASSFIVSNFSTLGKIEEVKTTLGSNWLHLRYSNPLEARRALERNGKVLGHSIMVGVIRSDEKVIEDADRASFSAFDKHKELDTSRTTSKPSVLKERNSEGNQMENVSIKSKIRPLAGGYVATDSASNVSASWMQRSISDKDRTIETQLPAPAPSGIFTKAMEYIFGW